MEKHHSDFEANLEQQETENPELALGKRKFFLR